MDTLVLTLGLVYKLFTVPSIYTRNWCYQGLCAAKRSLRSLWETKHLQKPSWISGVKN